MTLSALPAQMFLISEQADIMLLDELVASFDYQQQSINYLDENSSNNIYPTNNIQQHTQFLNETDVALSPEDEETLLSLLSENEADFNFEMMDQLLDNSNFVSDIEHASDLSKHETDIEQQILSFSLSSPLQRSDEVTYVDLVFLTEFNHTHEISIPEVVVDGSTSPKPEVAPIKRKIDDLEDDEEDEDEEEPTNKKSKRNSPESSNKKESNKLAAIKYRQKKVKEKDELFERRDAFALRNKQMRKKIEDVQMEISYIKSLLVQALIAKSSP